MYIAMNRFQIALGRESGFENLWRQRESMLDEVPGFREFHLLRGPTDENATLFSSHTAWNSCEAFEVWPNSERLFEKRMRKPRLGAAQFILGRRGASDQCHD